MARTPPASTDGGSDSRPIASTNTITDTATSRRPLTSAARISPRWRPNVRRPRAGRVAIAAASRPSAIAPTSESTCPASASSATDPNTTAPTTPATSSTTLIARAIVIFRRLPARPTPCELSWGCMRPLAAALGLRRRVGLDCLADIDRLELAGLELAGELGVDLGVCRRRLAVRELLALQLELT